MTTEPLQKNSIEQVSLSRYLPTEAIEKENRSGWIDYGQDNMFQQYLINLYHNSPIHNALTNSIAFMIEGQGTGTILDNALQGIAFDLKLQGGFAAEVIWSMDFTRVVKINHLPFENCRLAYDKEEDEITGIYYSKDWKNTRSKKGKPEFIPAFDPSQARECPRQVMYAHGMMAGSSYYPKPDYFGSLNYIELSYQMGMYHVNNILNGLFPSFIINFLNGIPQKEEREALRREWEERLSGANNAGKFLMTFNEDPTRAPQINPFPLSDADKQYEFLSDETAKQIMIGHRITSPLLFGIRQEGGFGSNKDEMVVALEIFNNQVIKPYQRIIEDTFSVIIPDLEMTLNGVFDAPQQDDTTDTTTTTAIEPTQEVVDGITEKVSDVTYNGAQIASALEIVAAVGLGTLTQEQAIVFLVQFLGLDVDVAKSMFQTGGDAVAKLSAQKKKVVAKKDTSAVVKISKEEGDAWLQHLTEKAEYIDLDEWQLVSEEDVTEPENELQYTSEFFAKRNKMPSIRDAKGEKESTWGDAGLYKLRYAYSQNISEDSREFCKQMVKMSQAGAIFRYEDIQDMSDKGVNKAFAPSGAQNYSLFRFVGGSFCHHFWKRLIYIRKRDTKGRILPNNGLENDKRVGNNPFVPQKGIEGTAPINRPDRGSLKYP